MNFWNNLFEGVDGAWSGGVPHSIIILAIVVALGKLLGRYKVAGVSLGVTWVLFVGIIFSHFGMTLDHNLLHFVKELGLILFVYSIGLQVGPGFFATFRSGGLKLNMLALFICIGGCATAIAIHYIAKVPITTITGIMSGAVTNTPGLGAAQTAYVESFGKAAPDIALGYAVAYPLGVIGAIFSFILIRQCFYRKGFEIVPAKPAESEPQGQENIKASETSDQFISRRFVVSKRKLNGLTLGQLRFEETLGLTITRIRRSGIELKATPDLRVQYGDLVTVVGRKEAVDGVEKILGNSLKRLDEPNLIPIFFGIALGVLLGSVPVVFPGVPQPVKLGLAGGPLIVSILMSYFGPRLNLITYATPSANLMLREIGISLFLACVGLEAGSGFVDTIVNKGGLVWIAYGAIITVVPLLLAGIIGRFLMKLDYRALIGLMSGACTNPPALAFAGEQDRNSDLAAVSYAAVYPLSMFMRVLIAQLMILFLC